MKSDINKLIRANEIIIKIKKEAKILSKLTNKPITECQNIVSKKMGFFDWHTLHNKIKQDAIKNNNIITNVLLRHFKSNNNIFLSSNKTLFTIKVYSLDSLCLEIIENISCDVVIDFYKKQNIDIKLSIVNNNLFCNLPLTKFPFSINSKNIGKVKHFAIPLYPNGIELILKPIPNNIETYSLNSLGFSQHQEDILLNNNNYGAIFIAGTSTSGKEDTLNSLADSLSLKYGIKSIFDFTENIPNISYSDINNAIVKIELKDQLAKNLICELSKNNIVISSLHSSYSFAILSRLQDFNIHTLNLKSLVYQDKLMLLCNHCKQKANTTFDFDFLTKIKSFYPINQKNIFFRNNNGCKHCYSGFKNTIIASEIIEFDNILTDNDLSLLIKDNRYFDKWLNLSDKNIMSDNTLGKLSYHNALKKMFNGQLCPHYIVEKYHIFNKLT